LLHPLSIFFAKEKGAVEEISGLYLKFSR